MIDISKDYVQKYRVIKPEIQGKQNFRFSLLDEKKR